MTIPHFLHKIVLFSLAVLALNNCKGIEQPNNQVPQRVEVSSITLNKTTAELFVGDFLFLNATVLPQNATEKTVSWSSDRTDIATVDNQGKVTAISPGLVTVKASAGGVSASCQIKIEKKTVPVTGITISKTILSLFEGETAVLIATVYPENADNKTVFWNSSDNSVASVNSDGCIKAIRIGTAIITATTEEGNKQASCEIRVSNTMSGGHEGTGNEVWF